MFKCATDVSACSQACATGGDPMNMGKCITDCTAKMAVCQNSCLTSCNVSATCKTAAEAYFKCQDGAQQTCSDGGGDKCIVEKCCAELKAAF